MLRFGIACVLSAACSLSQAACYSVYDGGGALLLRSERAPVDLQHRIGDVVPAKFGVGASMVFATDNGVCHEADGSGGEPTASGRAVDSVAAPSVATAPVAFVPVGVAAATAPTAAAGAYVFGRYSGSSVRGGAVGGSSASYPHTGSRGGKYRYTASGNKSYQRKGR